MLFPPRLAPGCRVGVLAPARKVDAVELHEGLAAFAPWKIRWQLAPSLQSTEHTYLSGTDAERCADLQHFLDDPNLDAILCARGGYGTTRIVDQLDFTAFRQSPKWIIGFSDVTALHLRLQREQVASIHGAVAIQVRRAEHEPSLQSLMRCLLEGVFELQAPSNSRNRAGTVRAPLVGGNLSLVADSLGTPTEINTEGKILLLEEVDEYHYKIDRMLVQLQRAGKLRHLAGLAIGHLTDMKETALPFGDLHELINSHVAPYGYPVAFGLPFGHAAPNHSWIVGAEAELRVTAAGATLRS
jgi:muramoyltetrapeptide carboxypeptidase